MVIVMRSNEIVRTEKRELKQWKGSEGVLRFVYFEA